MTAGSRVRHMLCLSVLLPVDAEFIADPSLAGLEGTQQTSSKKVGWEFTVASGNFRSSWKELLHVHSFLVGREDSRKTELSPKYHNASICLVLPSTIAVLSIMANC